MKSTSVEAIITNSITKLGLTGNTGYGDNIIVEEKSENTGYIMIPLPNCNLQWTFAAYDWAKKYCNSVGDGIRAYPCHYYGNDNANYLFIFVNTEYFNSTE